MVPKIYNSERNLGELRDPRSPHEPFSQPAKCFVARSAFGRPAKRERGFTLVELMIVVSVIAVVATIAFVGLRNNQYEGAFLRFTDDLVGTMTQARNRAIDDQTLVRVEVSVDRVEVYWIDPEDPPPDPTITGTGVFLWGNYRDLMDGGLIADEACITGMEAGITPPSEANDAQMPTDCGTNLPKSIIFQPDGSFALEDEPQPDAGMTMVIKDESSAQVYYSIIEMFPGGLIRKFDEIPEG
jgi:prepilin-type N-terminal cleavage/methylation domain-containing protein